MVAFEFLRIVERDGGPVYVIREDLKNKNLLFVGTQFSVFVSVNGGKSWTSLLLNAPTMAFHDLLIHPRDNDLIAATHSRGIWILDDISALQQATESALNGDAVLFASDRPATRWLRIARGGYGRGSLFFRGENPPAGALIHYFLKSKAVGPATVEISDITGANKTTFSIENEEAGIHRLVWDLRWDPPAASIQNSITNAKRQLETAGQRAELTDAQKAILKKAVKLMDEAGDNYRKVIDIQRSALVDLGLGGGMGFGGGGGMRGGMAGLNAEPGVYLVKLTVGGKTLTGKVTVRQDPML